MKASVDAGEVVTIDRCDTIIDGLRVKRVGKHTFELVRRFTFKGSQTLEWLVQRHGAAALLFGLAAIAVWFLLRREGGDRRARRPLTFLLGMLAFQGVVGITQYELQLPGELVWIHVASATLTWMTVLWTVATAGRLVPRHAGEPTRAPALSSAG